MAFEVVRKIVNGIWTTVVEDPGSGGGGAQTVLETTLRMDTAEVLALHDTPQKLVDGVPGYIIVPISGVLVMVGGGYNSGDLRVYLGAGSGWAGTWNLTNNPLSFTAAALAMGPVAGNGEAWSADVEPLNLLDGENLYITSSLAPTVGSGPVILTVHYVLAPTA